MTFQMKLAAKGKSNKHALTDMGVLTTFPSQESTFRLIQQVRQVLFPNSSGDAGPNSRCPKGRAGPSGTRELFESLSRQIMMCLQYGCLRGNQPCREYTRSGREKGLQFIYALPEIRELLGADLQAAMDGDPAAKSLDEIMICYPGFLAITVYRMAHALHDMGVPLLPRMMTEYAHSVTGIDIHPGAKIGRSFFIDHGTGVVVGETTEIGNRVRIYQGVTLGALSLSKDEVHRFRDRKRHPTIGDDVIIYANATILGEKAIIGDRCIIGGNVWITGPVPADTKVILKKPELIYVPNHEDYPQTGKEEGDEL